MKAFLLENDETVWQMTEGKIERGINVTIMIEKWPKIRR